jgi:CHRD domain
MTGTRLRIMAMLAVLVSVGGTATAARGSGDDDEGRTRARLIGYREVPAISTDARGTFRARMVGDHAFTFRLRYRDLSSDVQQAHIHFGQKNVAGGISVFLCSNLGNGPAGTATCPQSGEVTGTIRAAQVIGPAGQGITAGEFDELLRAIRAGVAYANVHSELFPAGEIRGQLRGGDHDHDDDD